MESIKKYTFKKSNLLSFKIQTNRDYYDLYYYNNGILKNAYFNSIIYFSNGKTQLYNINNICKKFHSTGHIKESFTLYKNKYHGINKRFAPNNQLILKKSFKNDITHGPLIKFNKGHVKTIQYYLNGKLHGYSIEYDKYGCIDIMTNYRLDKKNGNQLYFEQGRLLFVNHYKNNYQDKYHYDYDPFTLYQIKYYIKNIVYHQKYQFKPDAYQNNLISYKKVPFPKKKWYEQKYFKNGIIKNYFIFSHKHIHSIYRIYYNNGQLQQQYTCRNKKMHGIYQEYYDNGQLKYQCEYSEHKLNGLFISYDRQGNKKTQIECYQNTSSTNNISISGQYTEYDLNYNVVNTYAFTRHNMPQEIKNHFRKTFIMYS